MNAKLAIFACLVLLSSAPVRAEEYIVVLTRRSPDITDAEVTRLGGAVLSRLADRLFISISRSEVAKLREHPSVSYVQGLDAAFDDSPPGDVSRATDLTAPPTWASGDYQYDGAGNISSIGTSSSSGGNGEKNAYQYDSSSRLTKWSLTGVTPTRTEDYTYDVYGNMKSVTVNSGTPQLIDVEESTNQLKLPNAYDPSGNLTSSINGQTFEYDAVNMMTKKTKDGLSTFYVYTPDDERIGVLTGDTWTWSLPGPDHQVLRQYQSSYSSPSTPWLWIEDYVYGGGTLLGAARQSEMGGRRHFHLDHLGTPRLVTADDGAQISRHDYMPWGQELTAANQEIANGFDREDPRRFTGHERDYLASVGDTNVLDYMHARYFNPNIGRFASVDPAVGDPHSPTTWNRYTYAADNPINRVDPDGRNWFLIGGTWYWHAGNTYTYKVNGKSVTVTSAYTHLMVARAVGRNVAGGVTFRITLYNQNKAVHTGFGFSGGVNTGPRIAAGNYKIHTDIRDVHGPDHANSNSPDHNPDPYYGIQVIDHKNDGILDPNTGFRYNVFGAYGAMRARLNPMDPGMRDAGDYLHGQEDGANNPGETHGCLSYGRDYEFINYMWNLPPQQIPVAIDVPAVP